MQNLTEQRTIEASTVVMAARFAEVLRMCKNPRRVKVAGRVITWEENRTGWASGKRG